MNVEKIQTASMKLRALDHGLRRALLNYLVSKPGQTETELMKVKMFSYPQGVISKHISILQRAGFIYKVRRNSKYICNYINLEEVNRVGKVLHNFANA